MNNLTITGRLGQDAELRTTNGGKEVLNFSVANDTGYGDKKKTNWFRCAMWGQRATKLVQFMTKGTQVAVCGEVNLDEYTNESGTTRSKMEVNVRDLTLLGGGEKSQGGQSQGGDDFGGGPLDPIDEIPFAPETRI